MEVAADLAVMVVMGRMDIVEVEEDMGVMEEMMVNMIWD